jgi:putative heme-binding domain-containing protein
VVALADGRVLSGVVMNRDDQTLSLRTPQELISLPVADIEEVTLTDRSPMPDGLLDQLSEQQLRNLIAYLRHPTQVPLPESTGSAATLP